MNNHVIEFLIRAKKATYAGKGAEVASSRPGSHDLRYQEGNLTYLDTYLGGDNFSGEEALWIEENAFWAMNYMGRVIEDGFSGDFLKEALSLVPMDAPFRGPKKYENGDHLYQCTFQGWKKSSTKAEKFMNACFMAVMLCRYRQLIGRSIPHFADDAQKEGGIENDLPLLAGGDGDGCFEVKNTTHQTKNIDVFAQGVV